MTLPSHLYSLARKSRPFKKINSPTCSKTGVCWTFQWRFRQRTKLKREYPILQSWTTILAYRLGDKFWILRRRTAAPTSGLSFLPRTSWMREKSSHLLTKLSLVYLISLRLNHLCSLVTLRLLQRSTEPQWRLQKDTDRLVCLGDSSFSLTMASCVTQTLTPILGCLTHSLKALPASDAEPIFYDYSFI